MHSDNTLLKHLKQQQMKKKVHIDLPSMGIFI